jgi:hypothetical protein
MAEKGHGVTATAFSRGHAIEFDMSECQWLYTDTKQPVHGQRKCKRCRRPPTPEGHDACLGTLKGVKSACCGHGVEEPFQIPEDSNALP